MATSISSALETLLADGSIDKADARALLEVSKTRADDCLSKDDAGHYRHRCDALEMQHLPPTGSGGGLARDCTISTLKRKSSK